MKTASIILTNIIMGLLCSFDTTEIKKTVVNYVVTYGGSEVGSLSALEIAEHDKRSYSLESTVKVGFIVNVSEKINDVFENQNLTSSNQTRYINGSLKTDNSLVLNGSSYHAKNKDDERIKINQSITETVLSVYFKEPTKTIMVYSHYFQQMVGFTMIKPHVFKVNLPNGSNSTYFYNEGDLHLVETETQWGTLRFRKKK